MKLQSPVLFLQELQTFDVQESLYLYIDDMIIAAKTRKKNHEVKVAPQNPFKVKHLGKFEFILGMEIDHDQN